MKKLLLTVAILATLLIMSCDNGDKEKNEGVPQILDCRLYVVDQEGNELTDIAVDYYTNPITNYTCYFDFTVSDSELDIKKITITLWTNEHTYNFGGEYYIPFNGENPDPHGVTWSLPQQTEDPQIYKKVQPVKVFPSFPVGGNPNYHYIEVYITDTNDKKSKLLRSNTVSVSVLKDF